jgi:hypothetical protein
VWRVALEGHGEVAPAGARPHRDLRRLRTDRLAWLQLGDLDVALDVGAEGRGGEARGLQAQEAEQAGAAASDPHAS